MAHSVIANHDARIYTALPPLCRTGRAAGDETRMPSTVSTAPLSVKYKAGVDHDALCAFPVALPRAIAQRSTAQSGTDWQTR